jgi:hypothetical protein
VNLAPIEGYKSRVFRDLPKQDLYEDSFQDLDWKSGEVSRRGYDDVSRVSKHRVNEILQ